VSEWTRPDLSFPVRFLSRKLGKATSRDMKYLKRLVRFMHITKHRSLTFTKHLHSSHILTYTDSDWANDTDRKSQSGFLLYVFGNLCAWKSAKQDSVALSTHNAEYVALSEGAREAIYFKQLLGEVTDTDYEIYMRCDNKGAIKNAESELQHKKAKHIDIKYHFIKDEIEKGNINVKYIRYEDNPADIMTKPILPHTYKKLVEMIFDKDKCHLLTQLRPKGVC
jgi:hypothetical protein